MANDTREQLMDRAETLFGERGFYGVSIANIADELSLTKQALLHHFGSKAKLYGAVLGRISEDYEAKLYSYVRSGANPADSLADFMMLVSQGSEKETIRTRLIMRELLDNQNRAADAEIWYLRGFLVALMGLVRMVPGWGDAEDDRVLALVYQLLGAANYFAISGPTLGGIFGSDRLDDMTAVFPDQLKRLTCAALKAGPSGAL